MPGNTVVVLSGGEQSNIAQRRPTHNTQRRIRRIGGYWQGNKIQLLTNDSLLAPAQNSALMLSEKHQLKLKINRMTGPVWSPHDDHEGRSLPIGQTLHWQTGNVHSQKLPPAMWWCSQLTVIALQGRHVLLNHTQSESNFPLHASSGNKHPQIAQIVHQTFPPKPGLRSMIIHIQAKQAKTQVACIPCACCMAACCMAACC